MKNTAINTLTYTGIVTLSQYIGKKKVKIAQMHNTGGESLFRFLANCFTGNFESAQNNRPAKVKLLNKTLVGNDIVYRSVSGFIFVRNLKQMVVNSGECCVRYSFIIPRDLFEDLTNISTLGLGLYALNAPEDAPDSFVAFCALSSNLNLNRNKITNASLVVDWDLLIANNGAAGTSV